MFVNENIYCCRTSEIPKFLSVLFLRRLLTENIAFNIRNRMSLDPLTSNTCWMIFFLRKPNVFYSVNQEIFLATLHLSDIQAVSAYWIMLHATNRKKTVEEWKTNLMSLAILFLFLCAQHVSDINISILCHLLFYFSSYVLNMFRTLIYPSPGACDCVVELPHRSFCSVKTDDLALV